MDSERTESEYGDMLEELMDGLDDWDEVFTAWEQQFIESLDSQLDFKMFDDLTPKQLKKFEELWAKLNAHTDRQR